MNWNLEYQINIWKLKAGCNIRTITIILRCRMNFDALKKLFTELRDYLELQNDNSIVNIRKLVNNTVVVLESDKSESFKSEYVLDAYKSLYTGRAGLTEYYIWDNDYDKRMRLNEPLERIRDDLWEIMKQYV